MLLKRHKYCKNLFEKVKDISNKLDCKSHLLKYKSDIKLTCNIIKEVMSKSIRSPLPSRTILDIKIRDNSLTAKEFSNFFADIDPKLA